MDRKQIAIFLGLILIVILFLLAFFYTAIFILAEQTLKVGFFMVAYWATLGYMIYRFQQIRSV